LLPQPDYTVTITQWITYTGLFGVTGSLFTFALQTVRKALISAEKEIVERKRVEMELRKLTRAVEQSPASIVITDLDGSIEYVNPRFTQVTGYSFDEIMGKNPRILKTTLTAPGIHRQMWETLTSGNEWHGEFVNRKKDGSIYFESAIISPIADLNGDTTHYLAVKEDITERKRAEEKLRQQNEYFSILHQITLDLLNRRDMNELLQAIVDRAVILLDAPFGELMLEKDGELIVQTFTHNQKLLKGDRVSRADARLSWLAFDTKTPAVLDDYSTYSHRRDIYSKDSLHAIAELPVLVRDKCIGILAVGRSKPGYVFSDTQINNGMLFAQLVALVLDSAQLYSAAEYEINERKQAEAALQKANEQLHINLNEIEKLQDELREQAMRDPLTGLYNRRYLNETIEREIIRAGRENSQLSVIVSDIDHFKTVNDTCGHQIGDQFLMEVANLMKSHARRSDIVCRYGGEEFLLVLPGTTMESAAKRAEEIRQKCAEVTIHYEGKELHITLSFGVSTYPAHGHKPQEIIIKADKALYQSKHNGRNCVTVWDETSS
jgi:diguanylate cyclase (GGDEF)-like protein/PAS domain S-box-containing protein